MKKLIAIGLLTALTLVSESNTPVHSPITITPRPLGHGWDLRWQGNGRYVVEQSMDLVTWTDISNEITPDANGQCYFQAELEDGPPTVVVFRYRVVD